MIEESLILKSFSLISDCFDIEDSLILPFKTYTCIDVLSFNIEALIDHWILLGPAPAGLLGAIAGCSSLLDTDCSVYISLHTSGYQA